MLHYGCFQVAFKSNHVFCLDCLKTVLRSKYFTVKEMLYESVEFVFVCFQSRKPTFSLSSFPHVPTNISNFINVSSVKAVTSRE